MFDYQAGEKYKLTLIMVGVAGLMAGMFFTVLLMPSAPPPSKRVMRAYMRDPDVNGGHSMRYPSAEASTTPTAPQIQVADPNSALTMIEQWLPLAWDLSAGTAKDSQEKAILYMTPECAAAYRKNVWTADLAGQIDQSGLKSTFAAKRVAAGTTQADGTVVIFVDGEQTLNVPGKPAKVRPVKLEYLVKQTTDGLRIAGISEGGQHS
jgi:hypothetical protein